MRYFAVSAIVAGIFLSTHGTGICGERQGIIFGYGAGISPLSKISSHSEKGKLAMGICLGYSSDGQKMIVLRHLMINTEVPNITGFVGPAYYFYQGEEGRAFYVTGGIGLQYAVWTTYGFLSSTSSYEKGPGLLVGMGYEFRRHLQFDFTAGIGRTTRKDSGYGHAYVVFTLTVMAY